LVVEANSARERGLSVAAAVVSRVAVEEGVRRALTDIGVEIPESSRAWQREDEVFKRLRPPPQLFTPLDFTATRAAFSAVRSLGNSVAHDGYIDDPQLTYTVSLLLPRALLSLSNAVNTHPKSGHR
jgi:hypothetical protein